MYLKRIAFRLKLYCASKYLTLHSWPIRIRSWLHANKILINKPYNGEIILLLALYEKNILRKDIKNLLAIAQNKGLYVIAVNTLKLQSEQVDEALFDCYIERFNFGRDFGSYKVGFQHIFKQNYLQQCPRLIMLNDSVYYESSRTPKFIDDLMNTNIDALGATENFQHQHHLGSFCISIAGRILRHKQFRRFWEEYKNSEIRQVVIRNGELALSQCLKRLVTSPEHFCALYNTARIINALQTNNQMLNLTIKFARRSHRIPSNRIEARDQWNKFITHNFHGDSKKINENLLFHPVFDLNDMETIIKKCPEINAEHVIAQMRNFITANVINSIREGSQIHTNCNLMLYMGLPIVKLDAYFRGMLAEEDLLILSSLIEKTEADELLSLLLLRSYGGDTLFGWDQFLFYIGYV